MGTLSPYILFCPLTFPSCGTKCPHLYKMSSRTNVLVERVVVPYYIRPSNCEANATMRVEYAHERMLTTSGLINAHLQSSDIAMWTEVPGRNCTLFSFLSPSSTTSCGKRVRESSTSTEPPRSSESSSSNSSAQSWL